MILLRQYSVTIICFARTTGCLCNYCNSTVPSLSITSSYMTLSSLSITWSYMTNMKGFLLNSMRGIEQVQPHIIKKVKQIKRQKVNIVISHFRRKLKDLLVVHNNDLSISLNLVSTQYIALRCNLLSQLANIYVGTNNEIVLFSWT